MGIADTVTKEYMRNNAVFADAFNYLMYGGNSVIDAAGLHEVDAAEIALPFGPQTENRPEQNGTKKKDEKYEEAVQKYRDLLKKAVIMRGDKASYVLLGIENQTDVHYAMPVRNMLYDAMQYEKQISQIASEHRSNKNAGKAVRKVSSGEYLSGFYKEDRLIPVITLVIHFGAEKWDGPLALSDMMEEQDIELMDFVQDYKIHLIDPAALNEADLAKFTTSLREVMACIKYSKDKESMRNYITTSERLTIETSAARVINTITGTQIKIPEEEEEIDMCEAWEGIMEDCRLEGEMKGRKEGEARILATLIRNGLLNLETAAAQAGISEAELQEAINKLS